MGMDSAGMILVVIFGSTIGLPVLGLVAFLFFRHRQKMAELRLKAGPGSEAHWQALETRCAKLEEQVNLLHGLLHDEQRTLDRKLANLLQQAPPAVPAPEPGREARVRE